MSQLKSLRKSNEILKLFIIVKEPLTIKQIINELDYSQSTVYRIIKLLVEDGFLEFIGKGYYQPGWVIEELATSVKNLEDKICSISKPYLKELNEKFGETVILTIIKGNSIYVLEHIESKFNLSFSFTKGEILPPIYGASSKILLAFSDENFKSFALRNLSEKEKIYIKQQLEEIKETESVVTYGEVDREAIGIAVPIFLGKQTVGSISIAAPQFRVNDTLTQNLLSELHKYSKEISFHLKNS